MRRAKKDDGTERTRAKERTEEKKKKKSNRRTWRIRWSRKKGKIEEGWKREGKRAYKGKKERDEGNG